MNPGQQQDGDADGGQQPWGSDGRLVLPRQRCAASAGPEVVEMALAMMRRLDLQDEKISALGAQIAEMGVELERVEREACDRVGALTAELRRLRVRR